MNEKTRLSTRTGTETASHQTRISFTGNEKHLITLEEAIRFTQNHRRSAPEGSMLGGFFGRQIITKLLNQETCVGIRIYFSSQDDGTPTFVLAGVNANNSDLFQGFLGAHPIMSDSALEQRLSEDSSLDQTADSQTFSGQENHLTTLAEASRLTRNFRDSAKRMVYKGGFFGKNIFSKILGQPECVGIFIYYAQLDNGKPTLVLAGVDRMGRHFAKWPFGEDILLCPPFCAATNPLNH